VHVNRRQEQPKVTILGDTNCVYILYYKYY
jgi:hypothetical protein